jgi:hypothetical protein
MVRTATSHRVEHSRLPPPQWRTRRRRASRSREPLQRDAPPFGKSRRMRGSFHSTCCPLGLCYIDPTADYPSVSISDESRSCVEVRGESGVALGASFVRAMEGLIGGSPRSTWHSQGPLGRVGDEPALATTSRKKDLDAPARRELPDDPPDIGRDRTPARVPSPVTSDDRPASRWQFNSREYGTIDSSPIKG